MKRILSIDGGGIRGIIDGVADAANYQMDVILGNNFRRLQVRLGDNEHSMDDASEANIKRLENRAKQLIDHETNMLDEIVTHLT